MRVEIRRTLQEFSALSASWRALASATPAISVSQTYEYARSAWDALADDLHVELAIIAIWRDRELVCVWPLYTRRHGLWTMATHLGCGGDEEYAAPLTSPGVDEARLAALALLHAKSIADLLKVCNIAPSSALALAIAEDPSSPVVQVEAKTCSTAWVSEISDFQDWLKKRPKSLLKRLGYDRRRLSGIGALRSVVITGADNSDALVNWIFDTKIAWLDAKGIISSWVRSARSRRFFLDVMSRSHGGELPGGVFGIGLTLDGKFIAASICFLASRRVEGFIMAFDPAFGAYSPGQLLVEECIRYASRSGLDFDLRMEPSPYKSRWADGTEAVNSFEIVCSARGRLALLTATLHGLARPILVWLKPAYLQLRRRQAGSVG